jgi:hypothetical protein
MSLPFIGELGKGNEQTETISPTRGGMNQTMEGDVAINKWREN